MTGFRVTYATLSADSDALHADFDRGLVEARDHLGGTHASLVGPDERPGTGTFTTRSPVDHDVVIGHFAKASEQDVDDAVGAARAAAPAWAATPWQERADLLDRAADLISERRAVLAALMALEVGKNRLEALGDVEESADLIRYYTAQLRAHDGFVENMQRLSPQERTVDVMRPYGVWSVISPFNFPMALVAGPAGAALAAGNTVVLKPSEIGSLCGLLTARILREAGIPPGVVQAVTGPGEPVGSALVHHPGVDGITFTGSVDVGMGIYRSFATRYPKPVICEMGGKNPVLVTETADLDLATTGTMRSAFGLGGQKCSAASRAYVHDSVFDDFCARLVDKADAIPPTSPLERDGYLSPVIDEAAVVRYEKAVAEARATGEVLCGGERLTDGDLARGTFVAPTVVRVPDGSWLWTTELFVPLIAVAPVTSLDEALARANATPFGLTAGLFAGTQGEIDRFLEHIEAGVVYVNRAAGATTGAWPGVQPFGGWKTSGTNGKAGGGPYYLQQFLREQSRTIVEG